MRAGRGWAGDGVGLQGAGGLGAGARPAELSPFLPSPPVPASPRAQGSSGRAVMPRGSTFSPAAPSSSPPSPLPWRAGWPHPPWQSQPSGARGGWAPATLEQPLPRDLPSAEWTREGFRDLPSYRTRPARAEHSTRAGSLATACPSPSLSPPPCLPLRGSGCHRAVRAQHSGVLPAQTPAPCVCGWQVSGALAGALAPSSCVETGRSSSAQARPAVARVHFGHSHPLEESPQPWLSFPTPSPWPPLVHPHRHGLPPPCPSQAMDLCGAWSSATGFCR